MLTSVVSLMRTDTSSDPAITEPTGPKPLMMTEPVRDSNTPIWVFSELVSWAVQTQARYIGMVGSKRKAITVFRELTEEGLNPEFFERVHSPVGLDIGAITPEEIAVSIVAELIGIRRNAERPLPHMSWFRKYKSGAMDATSDDIASSGKACCGEVDELT